LEVGNLVKKTLGNKSVLYPYPVTLIGANVNDKPNFLAISFIGIVNANPGMIAFGLGRKHYTNRGIFENKNFSVNLPSKDMIEIVDYIGIYSGKKIDKSRLFDIFYGKLKNAPMIKECPINIECEIVNVLDHGGADNIIIGEIIESYIDEIYLTNGNPDIEKMKPFLLSMYDNKYFEIGRSLGKAWNIGKNYNPNKKNNPSKS
jgi:flavin reductase (DIM6/NTAB) family NADH-FMN oxidoreductase RutF